MFFSLICLLCVFMLKQSKRVLVDVESCVLMFIDFAFLSNKTSFCWSLCF